MRARLTDGVAPSPCCLSPPRPFPLLSLPLLSLPSLPLPLVVSPLPAPSPCSHSLPPSLSLLLFSVYTYQRVHAQSNRVANYLRSQGIQKGDVVAIFAHRSVAIVYAIMGVLKAGATFTVIGACCVAERRTHPNPPSRRCESRLVHAPQPTPRRAYATPNARLCNPKRALMQPQTTPRRAYTTRRAYATGAIMQIRRTRPSDRSST